MEFEKPQFEAFLSKKKGSEPETAQKKPTDHSHERDELKAKTTNLAREAQQAFAANDLAGTLEKLKELARAANPEKAESFEF